jgi:predicted nucleic acid-binding protein
MTILVDTNVVSELVRPRPAPRVIEWAGGLAVVVLSTITVEEVFFGLAAKPNPRIERWFTDFLENDCRVLDVTAPIARHAGVPARTAREARTHAHAGRHVDRRDRRVAWPDAGDAQRA